MCVLNKRIHQIPEHAVYVGRPTMWGNPFVVGTDGDRTECVQKYRRWLLKQVDEGRITLQQLADLHGRDLVCWCAPYACHADVLVRAAEWAVRELQDEDNWADLCEANDAVRYGWNPIR